MQVAYEVDFGEEQGFGDITWGLPETDQGENIRIVKVCVIKGTNLAKKDIFGLSDPYCVIQLVADNPHRVISSLHTKVKKKTLQPVWNTHCLFRVDTSNHRMVFKIFDENRLTRDDFLGEATATLRNLYTDGDPGNDINSITEYPLTGRSHKSRVRGTVTVSILLQDNNTNTSAPPTPSTADGLEEVDGFMAFQIARDLNRVSEEETAVEVPPIVEQHEETSSSAIADQIRRQVEDTSNEAEDLPPLPPGVEERQDANGRTFYVNHETRTTTWVRPVAEVPPSPEMLTTPEMDMGFVLRRHISQEDSVLEASPPEPTPPVRTQPSIEEVVEEEQEEEEVVQVEPESDVIPPGWEARRVPQEGGGERILYINHSSRTTTWVRPEGFSESAAIAAAAASATPSSTPAASLEQGNSVTRPSRTTTIDTDTRPPPTPPNEPSERLHPDVPSQSERALPPGWAMQLAPNGRVFFIDHNTRKTAWVDPRTNIENTADNGLGALPEGWEQRSHSDGRVFFIDHATQSTQWEDPRIQSKVKAKSEALPYSRDYKRKYDYFRSRLKPPENVANKYEIHVRRKELFEDSYRFVLTSCKNVDLLKTKLWIVFDGETGLDYGGVSREWFYLLSKEIFNPYYGLFEYSATDNYTLQINPNSGLIQPDHLSYFKFIGRVAGMAVYHGKLLDAFFIRPFYKMLLSKKITLQDLESVDSEYHNSLKWLLENDPEVLDLTFVIEEDVFGQFVSRELCPDGNSIPVTQSNKLEYIDLVIKWRFIDRIEKQMKEFAKGFHDIIPANLIQMFDERELEYLLCGLGEINVGDWRLNTQYRGGYHDKHVVIQWFWKAVETFDNEIKARLLQFVTGTSRVPMNGFAELYGSNGPQKFAIERWGNPNQLPRSHTCFNRLDLPPYLSYHELREKLRLAIENTEGFEGVD